MSRHVNATVRNKKYKEKGISQKIGDGHSRGRSFTNISFRGGALSRGRSFEEMRYLYTTRNNAELNGVRYVEDPL